MTVPYSQRAIYGQMFLGNCFFYGQTEFVYVTVSYGRRAIYGQVLCSSFLFTKGDLWTDVTSFMAE